jgi:16S rRNA processing protein RimM
MKADLVAIGKITKPHGIRGELKVMFYLGLRDLITQSPRLWLVKDREAQSFSLERVRGGGRFLILKLQDVNDPAVAEHFRDWEVAVPRDKLPPLPEGKYYTFQLVGLKVFTEDGEAVGEIREVQPGPAHDLYSVMGQNGEVLIPAVKEIVTEIDLNRGRVIIRPPKGLME